MIRHLEPTRESAHNIIRCLLDKKPIALDISRRIVDQGKKLEDTPAGSEVAGDLADALRKHQADIEQLKLDQAQAAPENDKKWQKEIEEQERTAHAASRALEEQIESLKQGHGAQ
ncbi:hypothetical protein RhiLY_11842 [Ceratobasidium sp. AG-Ba]|nr:hypothetical protein RhiLY_11842 [Ceratobasidium sp. AG-Ba]